MRSRRREGRKGAWSAAGVSRRGWPLEEEGEQERERTRHIGEGKREGGRVRQPQGGKASIGKGGRPAGMVR